MKNLSIVPVAAAALGPVAGLGAARVVCSHFSVIVRDTAQLFVAGPPVVAMAGMGETPDKEELGGARMQARAGAVDNVAADEDDALDQLKRFLSYLPQNVWEAPPVEDVERPGRPPRGGARLDRPARPAPARTRCAASSRPCSTAARSSSWAPRFGRPTITCLARLGGRPVGVLASDPEHYGGGVTADAAEKTARFVDMCDQFHLPVVNFVDIPGFVIGTAAERAGTIRRGARGLFAIAQASVPWVSILVRKVYGVAGAGPRRRLAAEPAVRLAVRATGARCRWRAGSRRPTGASSRRPRTRRRCARRSPPGWRR